MGECEVLVVWALCEFFFIIIYVFFFYILSEIYRYYPCFNCMEEAMMMISGPNMRYMSFGPLVTNFFYL